MLDRDREQAPIGGERARRGDEPQALVVARERGFDQPAPHAPRLRVREVEVHEEVVALTEVGDFAAVRRQRRGHVQRALGALLGQQRLRDAPRAVVLRQLRQVGRLNGVPPFVGQLVEAQAQRAVEGVLDSGGRGRLEDLADHLIAPLLPDERP